MRCEVARELLQEHLDGQLPLSEAWAVEAHLDACAACRDELASLRRVDAALATLPVLEETADFTARVMAQVQARKASPSPVTLPAFRSSTALARVLRWEDAVVSFAFAWAMVAVLLAFVLLGSQDVSSVRASLQQTWWTLIPELDRLWHIVQTEPAYAVWGLSSLGVAAAAAASAIVLVRQWSGRSMPISRKSTMFGGSFS